VGATLVLYMKWICAYQWMQPLLAHMELIACGEHTICRPHYFIYQVEPAVNPLDGTL